jgi:hypothetical protein
MVLLLFCKREKAGCGFFAGILIAAPLIMAFLQAITIYSNADLASLGGFIIAYSVTFYTSIFMGLVA